MSHSESNEVNGSAPLGRKPSWLRRAPGSVSEARELKRLLRSATINTVCEEARCPNIGECFSRGTATFMILGDICTRGCRFCSVTTGKPLLPEHDFEAEGERVAAAAEQLKLQHVVITSVARDDLPDGGASGFVATVRAVRERLPSATIEILVPDFRGKEGVLEPLLSEPPDVFNHNLETVPRLYRRVRPGASYRGSLDLLSSAASARPDMAIKSGIMLGLGETREEVIDLMRDAHEAGVTTFTAGQYLQPSRRHLPVEEYVRPERFSELEVVAKEIGFQHAFMGPLVRSSYHADEFV